MEEEKGWGSFAPPPLLSNAGGSFTLPSAAQQTALEGPQVGADGLSARPCILWSQTASELHATRRAPHA
jgi:hypothetical protein